MLNNNTFITISTYNFKYISLKKFKILPVRPIIVIRPDDSEER